jgi:hypothetical protein
LERHGLARELDVFVPGPGDDRGREVDLDVPAKAPDLDGWKTDRTRERLESPGANSDAGTTTERKRALTEPGRSLHGLSMGLEDVDERRGEGDHPDPLGLRWPDIPAALRAPDSGGPGFEVHVLVPPEGPQFARTHAQGES